MPATLLQPCSVADMSAAVLDTAGPLAIAGAGTAAGWAGELGPVDAVLDTSALTGVIVHNPGDMTVAVRAGTPLRALQEELAAHGQHVALDAARVAEGATVGGLLATADAGPAALVRGSLRDLVIGVTLVLADGTVAHSGGHVIKNVAGYDLAKLVHGSHGTLAVIAEVVLRLHPVAPASATVAVDGPLDEATALAAAVLDGPHEPAALEWCRDPDGRGMLLVRVEGTAAALPARVDRLRTALSEASPRDPRHGGGALRSECADSGGAEHDRVWAHHAAVTRGGPGLAVLRLGVRPSRLSALLRELPVAAATVGLGTGVATVSVAPDAVADVHAAVHAAGGTSSLRARPAGVGPAWGSAPSALPVLRALKDALDPQHRLGPGRFDPWM